MSEVDTPRKRGFALLDPERMKEIVTRGGKTAWAEGRAHKFTAAEAKEAAAKSVAVRQAKKQEAAKALIQQP